MGTQGRMKIGVIRDVPLSQLLRKVLRILGVFARRPRGTFVMEQSAMGRIDGPQALFA